MMPDQIDFAIVTALQIERKAVTDRLSDLVSIQEDGEPITYYKGSVEKPGSAGKYRVVVTELLGVGNDEAAVATIRLVKRWNPSNVILVGIGGGVPGKVQLGDVVVAEHVYYYEMAKLSPGGNEPRPQQFPCNSLLYGRTKAYEAADWKSAVGVERPDARAQDVLPAAHFGPIGTGEKVIADSDAIQQLVIDCPKMLAVAMEGAGVPWAYCSRALHPPPQKSSRVYGEQCFPASFTRPSVTRQRPD